MNFRRKKASAGKKTSSKGGKVMLQVHLPEEFVEVSVNGVLNLPVKQSMTVRQVLAHTVKTLAANPLLSRSQKSGMVLANYGFLKGSKNQSRTFPEEFTVPQSASVGQVAGSEATLKLSLVRVEVESGGDTQTANPSLSAPPPGPIPSVIRPPSIRRSMRDPSGAAPSTATQQPKPMQHNVSKVRPVIRHSKQPYWIRVRVPSVVRFLHHIGADLAENYDPVEGLAADDAHAQFCNALWVNRLRSDIELYIDISGDKSDVSIVAFKGFVIRKVLGHVLSEIHNLRKGRGTSVDQDAQLADLSARSTRAIRDTALFMPLNGEDPHCPPTFARFPPSRDDVDHMASRSTRLHSEGGEERPCVVVSGPVIAPLAKSDPEDNKSPKSGGGEANEGGAAAGAKRASTPSSGRRASSHRRRPSLLQRLNPFAKKTSPAEEREHVNPNRDIVQSRRSGKALRGPELYGYQSSGSTWVQYIAAHKGGRGGTDGLRAVMTRLTDTSFLRGHLMSGRRDREEKVKGAVTSGWSGAGCGNAVTEQQFVQDVVTHKPQGWGGETLYLLPALDCVEVRLPAEGGYTTVLLRPAHSSQTVAELRNAVVDRLRRMPQFVEYFHFVQQERERTGGSASLEAGRFGPVALSEHLSDSISVKMIQHRSDAVDGAPEHNIVKIECPPVSSYGFCVQMHSGKAGYELREEPPVSQYYSPVYPCIPATHTSFRDYVDLAVNPDDQSALEGKAPTAPVGVFKGPVSVIARLVLLRFALPVQSHARMMWRGSFFWGYFNVPSWVGTCGGSSLYKNHQKYAAKLLKHAQDVQKAREVCLRKDDKKLQGLVAQYAQQQTKGVSPPPVGGERKVAYDRRTKRYSVVSPSAKQLVRRTMDFNPGALTNGKSKSIKSVDEPPASVLDCGLSRRTQGFFSYGPHADDGGLDKNGSPLVQLVGAGGPGGVPYTSHAQQWMLHNKLVPEDSVHCGSGARMSVAELTGSLWSVWVGQQFKAGLKVMGKKLEGEQNIPSPLWTRGGGGGGALISNAFRMPVWMFFKPGGGGTAATETEVKLVGGGKTTSRTVKDMGSLFFCPASEWNNPQVRFAELPLSLIRQVSVGKALHSTFSSALGAAVRSGHCFAFRTGLAQTGAAVHWGLPGGGGMHETALPLWNLQTRSSKFRSSWLGGIQFVLSVVGKRDLNEQGRASMAATLRSQQARGDAQDTAGTKDGFEAAGDQDEDVEPERRSFASAPDTNPTVPTAEEIQVHSGARVVRGWFPEAGSYKHPMLKAVCSGNVDMVKKVLLLAKKAKGPAGMKTLLAARGEDGATSLSVAMRTGQPHLMKLLLDAGADVECKDALGQGLAFVLCQALPGYDEKLTSLSQVTALYGRIIACEKEIMASGALSTGSAEQGGQSVKKLSERFVAGGKAESKSKSPSGAGGKAVDPLMVGTALRMLLRYNIDIDRVGGSGQAALMVAGDNGNTVAVQVLLRAGARVDSQDDEESTALLLAAQHGHLATVYTLLAHGADIDHQDEYGQTALMLACDGGWADVVGLLVACGADVFRQDEDGQSALLIAVRQKAVACVRVLLTADLSGLSRLQCIRAYERELGKDSHQNNLSGGKLLASSGRLPELEKLDRKDLLAKTQPERQVQSADNLGRTALFAACEAENREIVAILLKHKAPVDSPDDSGETPLLQACRGGHTDIVSLLVQAGASVESRGSRDAVTPLMVAASGRSSQAVGLVRLLLSKGARVDGVDSRGQSVLDYAVVAGNEPVVRVLQAKGAECKTQDLSSLLMRAQHSGSAQRSGSGPATGVSYEDSGKLHAHAARIGAESKTQTTAQPSGSGQRSEQQSSHPSMTPPSRSAASRMASTMGSPSPSANSEQLALERAQTEKPPESGQPVLTHTSRSMGAGESTWQQTHGQGGSGGVSGSVSPTSSMISASPTPRPTSGKDENKSSSTSGTSSLAHMKMSMQECLAVLSEGSMLSLLSIGPAPPGSSEGGLRRTKVFVSVSESDGELTYMDPKNFKAGPTSVSLSGLSGVSSGSLDQAPFSHQSLEMTAEEAETQCFALTRKDSGAAPLCFRAEDCRDNVATCGTWMRGLRYLVAKHGGK